MGGRGASSASGGGILTPDDVTEDEWADVYDWSFNAYRAVRAGKSPDLEQRLETFIDGKSHSGEIHRGVATNEPLNYKVGDVVDQKGISSWSKDPAIAVSFNEHSIRPNKHIFVMGGTKKGVDISKLSSNRSEQEVIVSKKSNQRVTGVEEKNGITYYYVEEV